MTPQEWIQALTTIIGTLGLSVVLVVGFAIFFYKRMWPDFLIFMKGFTEVLVVNSRVMQEISDTNRQLGEVVRGNSTIPLVQQTAILVEKMDAQHLGLSQQVAAAMATVTERMLTNKELLQRIDRKLHDLPAAGC